MATLKFKNAEGQWEVAETPCALKYTEQNLTEEQKAQARANIGVEEREEPVKSNPNLLDNSNFRNPVNQRGKTEYIGLRRDFALDRWNVIPDSDDASVRVNTDSITLVGMNRFIQAIDAEFTTISKDTQYTISISIDGTVYTSTIAAEESISYTALAPNVDWAIATTNFNCAQFAICTYTTTNIDWIKLEEGTEATEFIPKTYEEELTRCKRYYQKIVALRVNGGHPTFLGTGHNMDYYTVRVSIPIIVPMRITPSVTFQGIYTMMAGSSPYRIAGITGGTDRFVNILIETDTGFVDTPNLPEYIVFESADSYIALQADLL